MSDSNTVCAGCGAPLKCKSPHARYCLNCKNIRRKEWRHAGGASGEVRTCLNCGAELKSSSGFASYCSKPECARRRMRGHDIAQRTCKCCGKTLASNVWRGDFCDSKPCRRAASRDRYARVVAERGDLFHSLRETQHRHNALRRARKALVDASHVRRLEVFERDAWMCGICGEPIDMSLVHPHVMSASLDHIVPLALGGEHSYENCQAAHLSCNSSKGKRTM
jgi:5-methylcytosine-specific restriction endonuclease McrA